MTAVTVPATQGFFWDDTVTPETVTDLLSAVAAAQALAAAIPTATAAAQAAQAAAVVAQTAALASQSAAAASATTASTQASAAASSASAASTSASSATSSASAASTSASGASGSATSASSSATAAGTSATNASNSASAAATSATNANTSATNAANSATAASTSATNAATTLADAISKSTASAQAIASQVTFNGATIHNGAVTLSPASANVVASPTGTGTVTIAPATAGTIDNMALGATTPGTAKVTTLQATGLITPSTTIGIKGTAAADNAQAGSNGEEIISQMTGGGATVTITNATPAVVTWTSHPLQTGHGITFTTTGGLPTGLSVNTAYYAIVVNANTFRVATSVANAFAGTAVATSTAGSGTHTCISILAVPTAGTIADIMGVQLTAGDWEVSGTLAWSAAGAGAITFAAGWINTTSVTDPGSQSPAYSLIVASGSNSYGNHPLSPKRINVSTTTTVFLTGKMSSATQSYGFGVIRARRLR